MKPIPNLIPRFNLDYKFNDFIHGFQSIFTRNCIKMTCLYNIFGKKLFFFTNTGRTSLYLILKALNFPKGAKIGVPLYSCTVVFDAILKAGYVPYFIDIGIDNYTLAPDDLAKKIDLLDAIIVIHTFGRPAEITEISHIAGDVPIIEDCAHSLFSEYNGKQTGLLGFASFFSLGKYLSNGGGGMTLINNNNNNNNNNFIDEFERELNTLESFTLMAEIKNPLVTYIYSILHHRPWFGLFSPIGFYLRNITGRNSCKNNFVVKQIRKSNSGLLYNKLYGFKDKIELQRKNSLFLIEELKETSLILPYEKKDTYCNYYLFPLRFHNKNERDKAHEYLRNMGVDTAKLFFETPLKAKNFYEYKGDCSNSEIIANTILIIPNHYTLNKEKMKWIANCIKDVEQLL